MTRCRTTRGAILAVVMITSLVASIAAYTVLMLAVSQGRQGRFFRTQTTARYLAEAGMVIAKERLQANPIWCGGTEPGGVQQIDADANGTLEAWETVTITVVPCPRMTGDPATIQVSVAN